MIRILKMIVAVILEILLTVLVIKFAIECTPGGQPYVFYFFSKKCVIIYEYFVGMAYLIGVLSTAMMFIFFKTDAAEQLRAYEKKYKELQEELETKEKEKSALKSKIITLETAIQKAFDKKNN